MFENFSHKVFPHKLCGIMYNLQMILHYVDVYTSPEGGDKAARDMRDMRHEQSIREGAQQAGVFAGFERYTKGVGSKVLRRSGWTEGSGVGRASDGRTVPVDTEGQHPHNKTGFGSVCRL